MLLSTTDQAVSSFTNVLQDEESFQEAGDIRKMTFTLYEYTGNVVFIAIHTKGKRKSGVLKGKILVIPSAIECGTGRLMRNGQQ